LYLLIGSSYKRKQRRGESQMYIDAQTFNFGELRKQGFGRDEALEWIDEQKQNENACKESEH
jgi:hypothetical protein